MFPSFASLLCLSFFGLKGPIIMGSSSALVIFWSAQQLDQHLRCSVNAQFGIGLWRKGVVGRLG